MARRKNTKRIDPRYFMDEKTERLNETKLSDFLRGRLRIDKPGQPLERMNQYRIEVRDDNDELVKSFEYRDHDDEAALKHAEKVKLDNPDLGGNEFKILKQKDMPGKGDSIEYQHLESIF